ncbi:MAG: TonB-dependent receptor plug domain-containing protein, partial [Novosphingobium sp.]|nr:TonB-dependent receptor plug domain-containing protein [Novosphingobium sp.]
MNDNVDNTDKIIVLQPCHTVRSTPFQGAPDNQKGGITPNKTEGVAQLARGETMSDRTARPRAVYLKTGLSRNGLMGAASIMALLIAGNAAAQGAPQQAAQADAAAGDEGNAPIVVTGFRQSLAAALDAKRNSNLILESVSAEDIGKFPDQNITESLQRLPGIQIDRENGQGTKVRIRGLEQNLTVL